MSETQELIDSSDVEPIIPKVFATLIKKKNKTLEDFTILHAFFHSKKMYDMHNDIVKELESIGYPHVHIDECDSYYNLIKNWKTYNPKNTPDKVLRDDHRIVNAWWKNILAKGKRMGSEQFKDYSLEEQKSIVKKLASKIRAEMKRRGWKPKSELKWELPKDMEISDIDIEYVIGLTDKELIEVWKFLINQPYEEDVYNSGIFVGCELYKRGLWDENKGDSKLAKEVESEVQEYGKAGEPLTEPEGDYIKLEDVVNSLPTALMVEGEPWAVYIGGRIVNERKIPKSHDIDLIVKQRPDPRVILAFKNLQPKWISERLHVIFDPEGPMVGNNIPAYKYGFFKTSKEEQSKGYGPFRELVREIKPFQKFRALKTKSGWEKYEFWKYDNYYDTWVSKYLDRGIIQDVKEDGRRFSIHKLGKKVQIITEDEQRDRSEVLPNVVKEILTINHDFILDTEAVCYDCKAKTVKSATMKRDSCENIAREDSAFLTTGKVSPDQESSVVFHAHDCLFFDGKSLNNLGYQDRREYIKKLITENMRFLSVIRSSPVLGVPSQIKKWAEKLRKMKGSEGIMAKVADSKYPITTAAQNRTKEWSKLKSLKSISVMVWERISKVKKTGEKMDQYMYDCVYKVPCGTKEIEGILKHQGKCYAPIGRTYGTSEKNVKGDIIEVLVGRIRKYKGKYTWMFPKYKEKRKEKKEPDTLDIVKKLAEVGPGMIERLSEPFLIRLKMCPYHQEDWCPLKKIFTVPRIHEMSVTKEYLKYPVICKLANIYKCYYIKAYYYGEESIEREK